MNRRTFSLSALGALASTLTACGGGGSSATDPAPADNPVSSKDLSPVTQPTVAPVELASPTHLPKSTVFLQSVPAAGGGAEAAPGQANFWDLQTSLALGDGYNQQFAGALNLSVSLGGVAQSFPADQRYADLTAYGPELDAGDGVKTVSFIAALTNGLPAHAHIHPTRGARLQQTLDLTNAQVPITLNWVARFNAAACATTAQSFSDEPFSWQVVLRDASGEVVETLFRFDQTDDGGSGSGIDSDCTRDLSAYARQRVLLSFEHDSPAEGSRVLSVSVTDAQGTQCVINGGFASGERGWARPSIKTSQNLQSARRTLHGLDVWRMFYTQPDALWGRWTDSFANTTGNPIAVTVAYDSTLGSAGRGVIYSTPGAKGQALTSWDGGGAPQGNARDIGMVFGSGVTPTFISASALATPDGSAHIGLAHLSLSVPAGGCVTLVNFIIMSGTDTGQTAASVSARATGVDALAADIANNFRSNCAYQRGMKQAQLDTLRNF